MAGLTGIVGNAVNAVKGSSGGSTSLQTFLDKFSGTAGRYVDTIDPLGLFEVRFVFQPGETPKDSGWLSRLGGSLLNSAKNLGMNALDSVTGGLASSALNAVSGKSVDDQRKNFKYPGKHTFMEYLAPANMLTTGEQWESAPTSPLMLDLSHYVQKMTNIQMQMVGDEKTQSNVLGSFPVNGTVI